MKNKKYNIFKKNKITSGFTLIEVMVVLAVIAILSTIAIPNFSSWRTNMYVKAAARDIYSSMQAARLLAVKENSNTAIVFDTTNSRYYLCDNWGVDGAWDGINDNTGTGDNNIVRTYYLNKQVRYGRGNVPVGNPVTGGAIPADNISYVTPDNVLSINSRGIGAGGYVYIANQDSNRTYAVGTQTSGLISILKWKGGSWQ
jgi:prepilin-type N-terminal cleavage/methylation domain-containing protein